MSDEPGSILVYVGLDRFGDGLMKLPFARALRSTWPKARITWLAGKGETVYAGRLGDLVAGLIDEVIQNAGIGLAAHELLRRPLPDRRFDLILDTQRRAMTSLVLRRIRHRRFVSGTAGWLLSDARPPRRAKPPAMIRQMLDLIEAATGRPVEPRRAWVSLPDAIERQAAALLPDGRPYVAIVPGAGDRRKCWPLDRFIALGRGLEAPVVLLGPDETEWQDELTQALPQARFPFQESALGADPGLSLAVARRLKVAVANDAGMGHLLAAGDCPLVSLFGPTPAGKFAPFAERLTVIEARSFGGDDMAAIPVDAVAAAVESHLRG
ncbi:MAG: lipopolysaccharide heptosyltransferase family protein [Alphaproteobacteria bacterium]|nr:lipopolysaccharide heptosyltransferase family protein [Alphaproteobacteria bacterium]